METGAAYHLTGCALFVVALILPVVHHVFRSDFFQYLDAGYCVLRSIKNMHKIFDAFILIDDLLLVLSVMNLGQTMHPLLKFHPVMP